nr:hypothetical protein [uncultured Campylobacter sp.]
MLEIRFNAIFTFSFWLLCFYRLAQLFSSFLRSQLAQPSALQANFSPFSCGCRLDPADCEAKKLGENSLERYRYDTPRLVLRCERKK